MNGNFRAATGVCQRSQKATLYQGEFLRQSQARRVSHRGRLGLEARSTGVSVTDSSVVRSIVSERPQERHEPPTDLQTMHMKELQLQFEFRMSTLPHPSCASVFKKVCVGRPNGAQEDRIKHGRLVAVHEVPDDLRSCQVRRQAHGRAHWRKKRTKLTESYSRRTGACKRQTAPPRGSVQRWDWRLWPCAISHGVRALDKVDSCA